MIAVYAFIIGLTVLALIFAACKSRIPTDRDVNDKTNKLNRMALDCANRKDNP